MNGNVLITHQYSHNHYRRKPRTILTTVNATKSVKLIGHPEFNLRRTNICNANIPNSCLNLFTLNPFAYSYSGDYSVTVFTDNAFQSPLLKETGTENSEIWDALLYKWMTLQWLTPSQWGTYWLPWGKVNLTRKFYHSTPENFSDIFLL